MNRVRLAFDFIERLSSIRDKEAVLDSFHQFVSEFGLSTFVLGDIANPHQVQSALQPVFESRWPQEWAERWVEKEYMLADPVVLETLTRRLPFFWRDIRPRQFGLQAQIMDEGGEFRLFDGLCIPIHRFGRAPATVTLAGEGLSLSVDEQKALHLAAIYIHAKIEQLVHAESDPPMPRLSNREREVLHWLAAGKSVPTIGDILTLSEHTVREYVKGAMRKLNATTQTQAVAVALRAGQLVP